MRTMSPRRACSIAVAMALARSGMMAYLPSGMPAAIWLMMERGSSLLGLSEVTMQASDRRAAAAPIRGRFPLSRSPPQPNTVIRRREHSSLSVLQTFSRASGVWA